MDGCEVVIGATLINKNFPHHQFFLKHFNIFPISSYQNFFIDKIDGVSTPTYL